MAEIKKVAIIGGGFAGLRALYNLSEYTYHFEITLIDKSEYSLEKPALFDVALDGKDKQDVNIFLPPLLREHNCAYVNEEVEIIDAKKQRVRLKNGESVYYDYLIISSGMKNSVAIKGFSEFGYSLCSADEAKKLYNALKNFKGKNITIYLPKNSVFEGIILELALRLREKLKSADITILTQKEELFDNLGPKTKKKSKKLLKKRDIKVVEQIELVEINQESIKCKDGSELTSDITICFPSLEVAEFVKDSEIAYDEVGIKTDKKMRVKECENIFAIGDINSKAQPKLGFLAIHQADVASSYLTNLEKLEDAMEEIAFNPEIFYVADIDKLEGLLLYTNTKFGGDIDKAWVSPLAKFMKMAFSKEYYFTNGKLPPQGFIKRLEKILQSID